MLLPDDLVKILLAVLVGGAIGVERELRDKAAGYESSASAGARQDHTCTYSRTRISRSFAARRVLSVGFATRP